MIFDRMRADVTWSPIDPRWYSTDPLIVGPGGPTGFSGFAMTPDRAMRVSTVFACVSLRADMLGSLPCFLYRRLANGGKERAKDHPLYNTVRRQPNASMTAIDFFSMGEAQNSLRGSAISEIQQFPGGRVELVPHHPDLVTIDHLPNGRLRYRIRDPWGGPERSLSQDEVLHVRDLTLDGHTGLARAVLAREAIGVAAAGEAFVGGFFKNDATGRLLISHTGAVPPKEKRDEYKQSVQENYGGAQNARRTMIVYGGAKVEELGKHDDGGFIIDPRKFQVADIARFYRVPGFMIGLEEKSTSWGSGLEQQKQGFVDFTGRPMAIRWEQALNRDLLHDDEREEYFFEFEFKDLLRGDLKSRSDALAIQRNNGVINPNEWRVLENMNPRDDDGGEEYQETPIGAAPNEPDPGEPASQGPPDDTPPPKAKKKPMAEGLPLPLVLDAASRIVGAEIREVEKREPKAKEDGDKFMAWAHTFFIEQRPFTAKVLTPLAHAFGVPAETVDALADQVEASGRKAVSGDGMCAGWAAARRDQIALMIDETFRAARAA